MGEGEHREGRKTQSRETGSISDGKTRLMGNMRANAHQHRKTSLNISHHSQQCSLLSSAISAGSSWLLYVMRHNMVTMVTRERT